MTRSARLGWWAPTVRSMDWRRCTTGFGFAALAAVAMAHSPRVSVRLGPFVAAVVAIAVAATLAERIGMLGRVTPVGPFRRLFRRAVLVALPLAGGIMCIAHLARPTPTDARLHGISGITLGSLVAAVAAAVATLAVVPLVHRSSEARSDTAVVTVLCAGWAGLTSIVSPTGPLGGVVHAWREHSVVTTVVAAAVTVAAGVDYRHRVCRKVSRFVNRSRSSVEQPR